MPEATTIIISQASLWDGNKQLPGTLTLTAKNLLFQFNDFQKSHLDLRIPLKDISSVDTFLIFEIARSGLRITSIQERTDMFILQDPVSFRKALLKQMEKCKK
jgi:hypothetical protein